MRDHGDRGFGWMTHPKMSEIDMGLYNSKEREVFSIL